MVVIVCKDTRCTLAPGERLSDISGKRPCGAAEAIVERAPSYQEQGGDKKHAYRWPNLRKVYNERNAAPFSHREDSCGGH